MAAPFRTYLDLTNTLIRELNEVELSSVSFANAKGIHKYIKDTINRAYFDICNAEDKWSFLAVGDQSDNYYGNVYNYNTHFNRNENDWDESGSGHTMISTLTVQEIAG